MNIKLFLATFQEYFRRIHFAKQSICSNHRNAVQKLMIQLRYSTL